MVLVPLATSLELGWLLSWNQGLHALLSSHTQYQAEPSGSFLLPFRPGAIMMGLWNGCCN